MQAQSATGYMDLARLGELRRNTPENLRAAAEQFEALFVDLWMRSQRAATDALGGGFLESHALTVHQEMLDHQWAIHLAENGSLGIAEAVVRQFQGIARGHDGETWVRIPRRALPPRAGLPAAVAGATSKPVRRALFDSAQAFVREVLPMVRKAVGSSGLSVTGIAAQAALETGWGTRVIGTPEGRSSHNLFGIKASEGWHGPKVRVNSAEVIDGHPTVVPSEFRVYESIAASISDLLSMLRGDGRYAEVLRQGATPEGYARALQRAGYATDPDYARKIGSIAASAMFKSAGG